MTESADNSLSQDQSSLTSAPSPSSSTPHPLASPEPVPGTSRDQLTCRQTPKHSRARLSFNIEVPSPSQVSTGSDLWAD